MKNIKERKINFDHPTLLPMKCYKKKQTPESLYFVSSAFSLKQIINKKIWYQYSGTGNIILLICVFIKYKKYLMYNGVPVRAFSYGLQLGVYQVDRRSIQLSNVYPHI